MKIYTKTGDRGETGLIGGVRVPKDHHRIQAYGVLDELNAALGVVLSQENKTPKPLSDRLTRIQGELFHLGAELATPLGQNARASLIDAGDIKDLENEIDEMEKVLTPLRSFILPGGSNPGAMLHLARTICRRAERETIGLNRVESVRSEVIEYLNRLGDYLFVAARWLNHSKGASETPWQP